MAASKNPFRTNPQDDWWLAEKGEVSTPVFQVVREIERRQNAMFDRFVRYEALYDPNGPAAGSGEGEKFGRLTENTIASNVDTATAHIATVEVRTRYMTDDADWSTQRRARHMEWYSEGLVKLGDVHRKCRTGFKQGAKKGTGVNKVVAKHGKPCVEPVFVDDIVVDDAETASGAPPRTMHHVMRNVDREALIEQFPKFEDEIREAGNDRSWRMLDHRGKELAGLVVIESWRLPIGKKPGRHTIAISGVDLLDEPYTKDFFPFAVFRWEEREGSWYGIGLAERIAGHQRTLNKINWQRERIADQAAAPFLGVRPADAGFAVRPMGPFSVGVIKGDWPQPVQIPVISPELAAHHERTLASSAEETGMNRMAMHGTKPIGLESGAALREYKDQTTARFAVQEKNYENFVLDTVWLLMDVCKDLGESAPVINRKTKWGSKKIKWADVDMGDLKVQIAAASSLPRTPAGRTQTVLEWAQAGLVTQDEARRLLRHPDIEHEISLITSDMEGVEQDLEAIEDGETVIPEPFDNHEMCVNRAQKRYRLIRDAGPGDESYEKYEAVLEGIRQYIVHAGHYIEMATQQDPMAMPADPMAGAAPMDPAMMDPTMMPPAPGPAAAPTAALAPTAMNLRAV